MLRKIRPIPNHLCMFLLFGVVCYVHQHPCLCFCSSSRAPTHRGAHKGVAPAGQSPISLCCKMSSNERVMITPSVLDILEHGTMRWCKGFEIPLPQGYQAGVSNSVVQLQVFLEHKKRHNMSRDIMTLQCYNPTWQTIRKCLCGRSMSC